MAFKMNGSPAKMGTISGTAGHGSALKMRGDEIASAFKYSTNKDDAPPPIPKAEVKDKKMANKDWKKGQDKAKSSGRNLDALVKSRKSMKKGSDEYNATQNQINSALGSKKVHGAKSSTTTKGKTSTTSSSKPGLSTKVESNKTKKNVITGGKTDVTKSRYEDAKDRVAKNKEKEEALSRKASPLNGNMTKHMSKKNPKKATERPPNEPYKKAPSRKTHKK